MEISSHAQKTIGSLVLMHLTCAGLSKQQLKNMLNEAKELGIKNILALRGDAPTGSTWAGGIKHAIDLVKLIRSEHGDHFGIAVGGHPEGHPDSASREQELKHLKEKVDAGADFIISQLFFDTDAFLRYVRDCRAVGIECPIIPGIMPIQDYNSFKQLTDYCKTSVPAAITQRLDPIKGAVNRLCYS
jgi:methylenetetrahydrofolate reductase (NADPH)